MTRLIPHENDDIKKIRFDIVILQKKLVKIENDIANFYRAMYAFDREYQHRLGDLADAVLQLRIELGLQKKTSQYDEVAPVLTHLVDSQYQLLKTAYRQAAKLCHPDHLPDNQRAIGLQLFDSLNKAYHLQDLVTVEHILWLLQSGQAFSDTDVVISDENLLKKRKELLGYLIEQKTDHLTQLRMKETYDVSNRDNWNILLYDYQTGLEDELAMLRGRANAMRKSKTPNPTNTSTNQQ